MERFPNSPGPFCGLGHGRASLSAWRRVAVVLTVAATAQPAVAADQCAALQAQYRAALGGAGRDAANASVLAVQLDRARLAAQQNRCNRFVLFGPRRSPLCPAIQSDVARLQRDLARQGGGSILRSGTRADLLRAELVSNGCGTTVASSRTYKTLCVRVCDGYYFPISNDTDRNRLSVDDSVCKSMYALPADAELFTMRADGEVADAAALDGGKRYGEQPFAFSYRSTFDAGCTAQLTEGLTALQGRLAAVMLSKTAAPIVVLVPAPTPRAASFENAATSIYPAGGFSPPPIQPTPAASIVVTRPIRFVGAAYYERLFAEPPAEFMPRLPATPAVAATSCRRFNDRGDGGAARFAGGEPFWTARSLEIGLKSLQHPYPQPERKVSKPCQCHQT